MIFYPISIRQLQSQKIMGTVLMLLFAGVLYRKFESQVSQDAILWKKAHGEQTAKLKKRPSTGNWVMFCLLPCPSVVLISKIKFLNVYSNEEECKIRTGAYTACTANYYYYYYYYYSYYYYYYYYCVTKGSSFVEITVCGSIVIVFQWFSN